MACPNDLLTSTSLGQDRSLVHVSVWRGQVAVRLLGCELDGVLVTDQYAGYRFIDNLLRHLCWAQCGATWRRLPRE